VAIVAVISLARQMLNRGPGWFSFSPALTRTIHEIMLRGFSWSGNQESVHRQSWPGAAITSTDTRYRRWPYSNARQEGMPKDPKSEKS
jgi:hypothetical protein